MPAASATMLSTKDATFILTPHFDKVDTSIITRLGPFFIKTVVHFGNFVPDNQVLDNPDNQVKDGKDHKIDQYADKIGAYPAAGNGEGQQGKGQQQKMDDRFPQKAPPLHCPDGRPEPADKAKGGAGQVLEKSCVHQAAHQVDERGGYRGVAAKEQRNRQRDGRGDGNADGDAQKSEAQCFFYSHFNYLTILSIF